MKLYFLVGRLGSVYGITMSEELVRAFKGDKPGRTAWGFEVAEIDGDSFGGTKEGAGVSKLPVPEPKTPKKHLFLPDTPTCLFCPCHPADPAAAEPCEKAPADAEDFQ